MNLPKLILTLIVGTYINYSVYAQYKSDDTTKPKSNISVSLSGGAAINDITFVASNRIDTRYMGLIGNYIKGECQLPIRNIVDLYLGLSYINKNYKFQRTGDYAGQYANYTTRYLNMPILLGINPLNLLLKKIKKIRFDILGGFYVGYWLSLEREGSYRIFPNIKDDESFPIIHYKETYDFEANDNRYNRFDYGLQCGGKLSYEIYKKLSIFIEYLYMYGTSDNQKYQARKTSLYYYSTQSIGLGMSYKF